MEETEVTDTQEDKIEEVDDFSDLDESVHNDSLLKKEDAEVKEDSPQVEEAVKDARPEYWPEDLWDVEKNGPKLEDASKRIKNAEDKAKSLRDIIAKKEYENMPKAPDVYDFEAAKLENYKDIANEFAVNTFSDAARQAGLTNNQANTLVTEYLKITQEQVDAQKQHEIGKLGKDAEGVLSGIQNFLAARVKNGTFSEYEANAIHNSIKSADAARAVSKMIMMMGEESIPTSVRYGGEHKTVRMIKEEMVDAKIKKDEKRVKELRAELEAMDDK